MSDHWGTPDTIKRLVESLGQPIETYYDPCPFKGETYMNGLAESWRPYNLVNPPFSNPAPWIKKAQEEWLFNFKRTIMILPAYTDRRWYINTLQPLLFNHRDSVKIVHIGRHAYIPLDGQKTSSPRFGSCLVGWNIPRLELLYDAVRR